MAIKNSTCCYGLTQEMEQIHLQAMKEQNQLVTYFGTKEKVRLEINVMLTYGKCGRHDIYTVF